jgi:hypothetical protein
MTRTTAMILGLFAIFGPSAARAADRLTDRDVKGLVSQIKDGRERFEDALEDKVKESVVRGASGEVSVRHFLKDFKENIEHLDDRLKPGYAASAEVGTVLRQASSVERYFRDQPPGTRGQSEWNRLAASLKTLASAYGASFPIEEKAPVRRIGDKELGVAVEGMIKNVGKLKQTLNNDLKKDASVDSSARQAAVENVDQFVKDAKELRDRVKDGRPSSAEADRVLTNSRSVETFIKGHQVPASASLWNGVTPQLQVLASAYGQPSPAGR